MALSMATINLSHLPIAPFNSETLAAKGRDKDSAPKSFAFFNPSSALFNVDEKSLLAFLT
jgi:hypothetical protein